MCRTSRRFPRLMIAHHEGAIEMAKTEQKQGANDEARKLAEIIVPGAPVRVWPAASVGSGRDRAMRQWRWNVSRLSLSATVRPAWPPIGTVAKG
ncbi:DUF305 domain-containing protein [Nonomuraea dietziae]|uniref:DUF305 domain-containing protein n=1 Tax=Nonomuraea dietziae TaxID=65515 RepID=UPI00248418BA|nr:DUF305 domain-containing protein [Nonomuraea dietziae]